MKNLSFFLALLIIPVLLFCSFSIPAQSAGTASIGSQINSNLQSVGTGAGFKSETETGGLPKLVGSIINIFLGILGVLFVILIVYGGYTWMTSFGSAEKTKKAKDLIVDAVIGLIILLAAYAISNFVVGALVKATVN
ncbi:pilin [Patescibacteria group bacterium]|nr:pilin [Patescibacteria group bacterium]